MTTPTASLSVLLTSSESADTSSTMVWLFWIATAVAISPLVARATRGLVPDVVSLLVLGALIGPGVLGLASTGSGIDLLSELGLGLLFLIAGTEIQPATLRAAQGRQAAATWILCMLLGFAVAWVFIPVADFSVALVLALAISSTALGALTPILRDIGLESTPLGRAVVTHGVMGELGPILVIAVLLGSRASLTTVAVLLGFTLLAVLVAIAPRARLLRIPGVSRAIVQGMHGTGQTGMRFIFWLLLSLMAAAAVLDLDLVIGVFAAAQVVWTPQPQMVVPATGTTCIGSTPIAGGSRTVGSGPRHHRSRRVGEPVRSKRQRDRRQTRQVGDRRSAAMGNRPSRPTCLVVTPRLCGMRDRIRWGP